MKKALLWVALIMASLLVGCGRQPSDKELREMIPYDVMNYSLDGVNHTSEIELFEVERLQVDEKDCIADCIVTMKDENLERTAYITMHLKHWDRGGWQLDAWEPFDEEECMVLTEFNMDRFKEEIVNKGFLADAIIGCESPQPKGANIVALYEIDQYFANLNAWGEIIAESNFTSSNTYPQQYNWEIALDTTSNMEYDWDITGEWMIENMDIKYNDSNKLNGRIRIESMEYARTSDTNEPFYRASGECTLQYKGKSIEYDFDSWDWFFEKGESISDIYLRYETDCFDYDANRHLIIHFYPDFADVRTYRYYNSMGGFTEKYGDEVFPVTKISE